MSAQLEVNQIYVFSLSLSVNKFVCEFLMSVFCAMFRVFVFADPAVFSESLSTVLKADIEAQGMFRNPLSLMRCVVQHSLQAALGEDCHGPSLSDALQVSDVD